MLTIRQIAQLAGVSRGTVDRVLNNRAGVNPETAARVRRIAEEVGYQPNIAGQQLAGNESGICASPLCAAIPRIRSTFRMCSGRPGKKPPLWSPLASR